MTKIVEWAKATRLIRVTGTRLAPVKKNAALVDSPLDLVLAMLAAYPKLGKSLFPRSTWRQSIVGDEFADISQQLLTALLASAGPCALTTLSDTAYDMIAARYVLGRLTEQQHDSLRRTIAVDIRIAMSALHVLGVVVLDTSTDHDKADDSAELTALGRYAIRRLRGMAQPGDALLQVRITLADVDAPAVWRRVLIPSATRPGARVIQAAMGWQTIICTPPAWRRKLRAADPDDELGYLDESKFRFGVLVAEADRIDYEYDFGDGWDHALVIEARQRRGRSDYPAVAAKAPAARGSAAARFRRVQGGLAGPRTAERTELLQWAGGDYDPDRFDLSAANSAVAAI